MVASCEFSLGVCCGQALAVLRMPLPCVGLIPGLLQMCSSPHMNSRGNSACSHRSGIKFGAARKADCEGVTRVRGRGARKMRYPSDSARSYQLWTRAVHSGTAINPAQTDTAAARIAIPAEMTMRSRLDSFRKRTTLATATPANGALGVSSATAPKKMGKTP